MRHWFGDQTAEVVVVAGAQTEVESLVGYTAVLAPSMVLHLYDYTSGDRILDLVDANGTPVTTISTDGYGRIPRFRGPDSVERMLIGQDPATLPPEADPMAHRWTIQTTSYPDIVDGLRVRITALEADSGGEYVSSAHPMLWASSGAVETRVSPHQAANLDGRDQTVHAVRASAVMAADSQLTVAVYTVDLDTGVLTAVESLVLTSAAPAALVAAPAWVVPDGAGLTVGVTVDAGAAENLTVQVMVR
ncbi:hypothetical protein [Nocardiopsis dassonvillei]|uniref:hypothetical protein n=1 Tax=Nocardiopsis dassonvillei TaxID=2014 RepID=UPI003630E4AC